jgi:hypothetical protein
MIFPLMPQFLMPAATVHRYGEGPGQTSARGLP